MAAKDRAAKDKAMASYLKKRGIQRTTTQCPFGHHPVALTALVNHLNICKNGLARRSFR